MNKGWGGERIISVGCWGVSKTVFAEGLYGMFSPPLSSPPALCFSLSPSFAKLFCACFCGVSRNDRAICCKMGYRTDVPV